MVKLIIYLNVQHSKNMESICRPLQQPKLFVYILFQILLLNMIFKVYD